MSQDSAIITDTENSAARGRTPALVDTENSAARGRTPAKKIAIFGPPRIGKTAILHVICKDYLVRKYTPTFEFKIHRYGHSTIYDFAGDPEYYPSEETVNTILQSVDAVIYIKSPKGTTDFTTYDDVKVAMSTLCPTASLYSVLNQRLDVEEILQRLCFPS